MQDGSIPTACQSRTGKRPCRKNRKFQKVSTGSTCRQVSSILVLLLEAVAYLQSDSASNSSTCCRHVNGDSPSQFWWQQQPQDVKPSHRHPNKRALFPVHVLEYSDNSIQPSTRTPYPPKAPLAPAAEYHSSTSTMHNKGNRQYLSLCHTYGTGC